MPDTESLPGTAASAGGYNIDNIKSDNGTVVRIRDGQTHTLSNFSSLSIPAGVTIDGIEVILDTAENNNNEESNTGAWIKVNDGSSTSAAKVTTAGNAWDQDFSDGTDIRIAGGTTDTWGLSWTPTTAAGISVILGWSATLGSAYYNNYLKVKVYYSSAATGPIKIGAGSKIQISSGKFLIN